MRVLSMAKLTLSTNYGKAGDTFNFHAWELQPSYPYLCGIWLGSGNLSLLKAFSSSSAGEISGSYTIPAAAPLGGQQFVVYDPRPEHPTVVASAGLLIIGNKPPVAEAGSDKTAEAGKEVVFSAAGSYDPDGSITAYSWSFGDGKTASGYECSHAYASAGTYTVTLTVTDNLGATGTDTCKVTVTAAPPPPPPPEIGAPTMTMEAPAEAKAGTPITVRVTVKNGYVTRYMNVWVGVDENYKPSAVFQNIFSYGRFTLKPGEQWTKDLSVTQPDTVDLTYNAYAHIYPYDPDTGHAYDTVYLYAERTVATSDKPTVTWVRKPTEFVPWDPAMNKIVVRCTNRFTFAADMRIQAYGVDGRYEDKGATFNLGAGQNRDFEYTPTSYPGTSKEVIFACHNKITGIGRPWLATLVGPWEEAHGRFRNEIGATIPIKQPIANIHCVTITLRGPPYQRVDAAAVTITGPETRNGTTNANGDVYFNDVKFGDYTITAKKTGYDDASATVSITGGGTKDVQLEMRAVGSITVKVYNQSRNPIQGATVRITEKVYPSTKLEATTNLAGAAEFTNIDALAPWELYVWTTVADLTDTFNLEAGESRIREVILNVPSQGTLTFVVKDKATATPIPAASVSFNGNTGTTNTLGVFSKSVNPGTYSWSASKDPYYKPASGSATVAENQTTTASVYLEPTGVTPPKEVTPSLTLTASKDETDVSQPINLTAKLTFLMVSKEYLGPGAAIDLLWNRSDPPGSGTVPLGSTGGDGSVTKEVKFESPGVYTFIAKYGGCNSYTANGTAVHLLNTASAAKTVTVKTTPGKGVLIVHAYADSVEVAATVEVVGVETRTTPFTLEVSPGTYTLNATYGTQTASETINVQAEKPAPVDFKFKAEGPPPIAGIDWWPIVSMIGASAPLIFDAAVIGSTEYEKRKAKVT